ncbi:MAG: hypothetical protein ACKPKO_37665, partial [Candidatus Fonsibacter sp.]
MRIFRKVRWQTNECAEWGPEYDQTLELWVKRVMECERKQTTCEDRMDKMAKRLESGPGQSLEFAKELAHLSGWPQLRTLGLFEEYLTFWF